MLVTDNLMILIAASYSTLVVCNDGLVAFPKPRFTSAMPAYDGSGDHSAITVEPRRTAKCTAARSSFAQAPSAENRNGTGPASRQLQEKAGGRYAVGPVLQPPARGSGSVAILGTGCRRKQERAAVHLAVRIC